MYAMDGKLPAACTASVAATSAVEISLEVASIGLDADRIEVAFHVVVVVDQSIQLPSEIAKCAPKLATTLRPIRQGYECPDAAKQVRGLFGIDLAMLNSIVQCRKGELLLDRKMIQRLASGSQVPVGPMHPEPVMSSVHADRVRGSCTPLTLGPTIQPVDVLFRAS